jgi:hypothetical protein
MTPSPYASQIPLFNSPSGLVLQADILSCKESGDLMLRLCDGFESSPWIWMILRVGILAIFGLIYWAVFLKR